MKRGDLTAEAKKLGISRQALWARKKRAQKRCGICGSKAQGSKCNNCREPDRVGDRKRWRRKHGVTPAFYRI